MWSRDVTINDLPPMISLVWYYLHARILKIFPGRGGSEGYISLPGGGGYDGYFRLSYMFYLNVRNLIFPGGCIPYFYIIRLLGPTPLSSSGHDIIVVYPKNDNSDRKWHYQSIHRVVVRWELYIIFWICVAFFHFTLFLDISLESADKVNCNCILGR